MLFSMERRHTRNIKRTSLNLDLDLVGQARDALQTKGTTETVNRALEEVVRRAALKRLAEWDLGGLTLEDLERMRRPRFSAEELEGPFDNDARAR